MTDENVLLCGLCAVAVAQSRHHLIPGDNKKPKVPLCQSCHDTLHALFTNKQLAKQYDSIEKLLTNERVRNWVDWRKTHPTVIPKIRMSNNRKKSGTKYS
jgi:hypothetical protein